MAEMDERWFVDVLMATAFNHSSPDRDVLDENQTNLTTKVYGNVFNGYPEGLLLFAASSCIIFMILGVPGNLVTVVALLKSPKLRNATTAFIVNLCLADAFFCVSSLPLAASTFIRKEWIHGETMCVVFPMIRYSNVAVSLFTVLAITINRYVLICHPTKYHVLYTKRKTAVMIVVVWLAALALLFPPLIQVWGKFGYDPAIGTCTILKVGGKSPKTFIYILAFTLPTAVFVTCYARIYYVVRKSSRHFQVSTISSSVAPRTEGENPFNKKDPTTKTATRSQKDLRLLKIVGVIYGSFVLCFVPVGVVKIFQKENDLPVINVIGYLGVFVSACLNPVIYVLMSKEYRMAYSNLVCWSKSSYAHSNS